MSILRKAMAIAAIHVVAASMLVAALAPASPARAQTPAGNVFTDPPKTYQLTQGWFQGRETFYYDFGSNSATTNDAKSIAPAPIYVLVTGFDAGGKPQMVQGQRNIIDVVPGDAGYSDLWSVIFVTVPSGYVANTLKSADEVKASGYPMKPTDVLVNCPVVPLNSRLAEPLNGSTEPTKGWYKGREVHYFDFGPNPAFTVPIFAFITGIGADGTPQFVAGQHNIIDVLPGQPGYSAFWDVNLVKVPAGYKANSITSADAVKKSGYEIVHPGIVVNCPVIRTADAMMGGGMEQPSMSGGMDQSGSMTGGESSMPGMPGTGAGEDTWPTWALVLGAALLTAGLALRRKLGTAPARNK